MLNRHSRKSGFTLIELLVSVGIVALLIGILLPVLGSVRGRSRELVSSVNLRTIGGLIEQYVTENNEFYPQSDPEKFYLNPNGVQSTIAHWAMSTYWHDFFAEQYPWDKYKDVFTSPGSLRGVDSDQFTTPVLSSYQYSASFLGDASIWTDREINEGDWDRLERSVNRSRVYSPSAKAIMWDAELPQLRRHLEFDEYGNLKELSPILFVDQHVDTHIQAEASTSYFNRATYAAFPIQKLHNTMNGVAGRDY